MIDPQEIRQRLRGLAGPRRRFGYRRLGILLAWERMTMNLKKLYQLYREEGLAVRRRLDRPPASMVSAKPSPAGAITRQSSKIIVRATHCDWRCLRTL